MPDVPPALRAFPFPLETETYAYSTNVQAGRQRTPNGLDGWGEEVYVVDEHYGQEIAERRRTLAAHPDRYLAMPHMRLAEWEVVEHATAHLAADFPECFALTREGQTVHWSNSALGLEQTFRIGDDDSLPCAPLEWIGRQVQEDLMVLDQRGDELHLDAALVTFSGGWSLDFNFGMSFQELHGPIPRVHELGVVDRARTFLLRLRSGPPHRRTNWTITVDRTLDLDPENYLEWGAARSTLRPEEIGRRLHLRVEVQHFVRLPRSNAVLFPVHTYLLPFGELVRVPEWGARLLAVLRSLPDDVADYKGISGFRDAAIAWLDDAQAAGDDAAP